MYTRALFIAELDTTNVSLPSSRVFSILQLI